MELVTALEYEYSMMAQSVAFDINAADLGQGFGMSMPTWLPGIKRAITTLDGGRWEIVSHGLAIVGGKALLTFLLRRPA